MLEDFEIIIKHCNKGWYWLLERGPHNSYWSEEYFDSIEGVTASILDAAKNTISSALKRD